jgi:hypothetical protein
MPDIFISPDEQIHETNPPVLPKKEPVNEFQKRHLAGHSHSRFSAFNLYPEHINFEIKEDGEEIVLMLRQHIVINLKWIIVTLLLLIGLPIVVSLGVLSALPPGYAAVITLIWYLVTATYAIEGFLGWYFNVFFITTKRIIDVDFFNLIDKRVSDAEIEKIQDVSYTTKGVLGTALNYGDVLIQTAAETQEFDFNSVPSPDKVVKILNELRDKVS